MLTSSTRQRTGKGNGIASKGRVAQSERATFYAVSLCEMPLQLLLPRKAPWVPRLPLFSDKDKDKATHVASGGLPALFATSDPIFSRSSYGEDS